MTSVDGVCAFGVTQPGDSDYPLRVSEGSAATIEEIRKRPRGAGDLYEDPDFPCTDASIGGGDIGDSARGAADGVSSRVKNYVWLRPLELCERHDAGRPNFAVVQSDQCGEGIARCSALDVRQGGLGDCWYLAGVAAIASKPEILNLVVPEDNYSGFEAGSYCGAFHFRFFDEFSGKYADVVVDDRIPCNAETYDSAFAHILSGRTNEFWPALIEKAFAKYHGSYRGIKGGHVANALEVLTGGFSGIWNLSEYRENYNDLVAKIEPYLAPGHFLGVGTIHSFEEAESVGALDGYSTMGLRKKHDYSVLRHATVKEKGSDVTRLLLQLRNPWGHSEWSGPLSDGDDSGWAELEEDLRPRNAKGATNIDEGAFWIDLRDVAKYCNSLHYCIFGMGQGTKFCSVRSTWPAAVQEQKLTSVDKEDFHKYPAFKFEVKGELLETVQSPADGKCVCCLRIVLGELGVVLHPHATFNYYIYEVPGGEEELLTGSTGGAGDLAGFYSQRDWVTYNGSKEGKLIELNLYLNPGTYVLVMALKANNSKKIPEAYIGKDFPFCVCLYSENETSLSQIN